MPALKYGDYVGEVYRAILLVLISELANVMSLAYIWVALNDACRCTVLLVPLRHYNYHIFIPGHLVLLIKVNVDLGNH